MAAPRLPQSQPEKEVVYHTLEHSFGPEVDGRGLERVVEQPPNPQIRNTFWTRKRLLVPTAVVLCVVGVAVGGAVGGTAAKQRDGGPKSRYNFLPTSAVEQAHL
jgi:hypothetical protein